RNGGREHVAADVGKVGELEETLDRAVFTERAMEDGEYDIDIGMRAGLGDDGARRPVAVLVDQEACDFVAFGVHRRGDGFGGAQGDLVLTAAASIDKRYTCFLRHRSENLLSERR